VTLQLSRDEALVLFEWLNRSEDQDGVSPLEHCAEQVALWTLSALLERELVAPFQQHYHQWLRRRGSVLPATDRPDVRHERFACLRD